ncbi:hypothetical protein HFQ13_08490 [Acidithiobacillus sp. VAN18-1]|uniref:Uncharacterized protein n=1 Tax=Igneacidithiobacillus copahuensis TaxID=2724909 RepID=A0AAE3CK97_9PROT|nr:VirB3 family type IV secretion system protein [Igneacidithiobacillus copahuensis]MBU2788240.1 hypothetical protein [Igneacidithiobacillus copahuensis]MBU2797116.1 hypothetical protein [Acidithiobacillus sp. VAN18-2]
MYQSLVRPHLLMGAERGATMINAVFAMGVYFFTLSIPGIIVAVSLFVLVQAVLRHLAKSDAQMIALVQRARKYQSFYGDSASLDAKYREIPIAYVVAPTTRLLSLLTRQGTKRA